MLSRRHTLVKDFDTASRSADAYFSGSMHIEITPCEFVNEAFSIRTLSSFVFTAYLGDHRALDPQFEHSATDSPSFDNRYHS